MEKIVFDVVVTLEDGTGPRHGFQVRATGIGAAATTAEAYVAERAAASGKSLVIQSITRTNATVVDEADYP